MRPALRRSAVALGVAALGARSLALARVSTYAQAAPAPDAPARLAGAVALAPAPSIVLYQYETCPFCNKVRAYLDWRRIPYTVVEVDPLFKSALAFSAYKKVPLAVIDGAAVGDSSAIIDAIERKLHPQAAQGGGEEAQAAPWRAWSDATLVKHLTVNIYRSWAESLQTFDYLTQRNFPPWSAAAAKYIGAAAMTLVAGKRRKELGIGAELGLERQALAGVLGELEAGLAGRPFLGGQRAGLGDVSIYGVMRAIKGLPTHTEAILSHPGAAAWCARMEAEVGPSMLMHRVGEK
jgi:microsomal prostaglandin-E synthase 2